MVAQTRPPRIDHVDPPGIIRPDEYPAYIAAKYGSPQARELYHNRFKSMGLDHLVDVMERYQTFSPLTPKNVHISVPLTTFAADWARNRNRFMIETLVPSLTIDATHGKFWRFDSPEEFRIEDVDEDNYAPGRGGGRPPHLEMETAEDTFECLQRALSHDVGEVTQRNADFNVKQRIVNFLTSQLQLRKALRAFNALTDTANMNNDTFANTSGSANKIDTPLTLAADGPAIQQMIETVVQTIQKNAFNSVDESNLWMVVTPTTAGHIGRLDEIRDLIKQSQSGERFLLGASPFSNAGRYNLPATLFGINVMVASTVIRTSAKGASSNTDVHLMSDDVILFVHRDEPSLSSLSTMTSFEFDPFRVEDHHIAPEHINSLQVLTNYDLKITAKDTGFLVTDVLTT